MSPYRLPDSILGDEAPAATIERLRRQWPAA
jgi:hypothetical protein